MKDSDLITKTVEGKSTSHHNIKSITFYCDGRHVSISLDSLRDNFRKARTEGILTETKDPHPYQSETEQKTPDHPLNYATMAILARIGKQAEFKEAWERLENAERNYICGDIYNIVKSACSHPYQSERDKVLNGDWVRDKFFEWVNSRERPPSIYACGKKWEELRQSKQDGE